jgi:hypothetical protein
MLVDCNLIVMRDTENDFGPIGCEHMSTALRKLTGLQKLFLGSTFLRDCGYCGA